MYNIVYLGAGLETAYYRLNRQSAMFYEVDLPEVIAARRSVLGEHANEILIGCDMFNLAWTEQIDKSIPTLLLVSGVFQYFTEDEVIMFINGIRNIFKEAELIFDATNETGIKYANKYVRKTENIDALMHFYVNDSTEFAKRTATTLIEERVFFADARKMLSKKLKLYTRIAMKVADDKKKSCFSTSWNSLVVISASPKMVCCRRQALCVFLFIKAFPSNYCKIGGFTP